MTEHFDVGLFNRFKRELQRVLGNIGIWIPVAESEAATGGGGRVKQHVLKLSEEFADAVLHREKTFEVRKNDRGFQKGDEVKFIVVDNLGLYRVHPLEDMAFRITYVLSGWHIDPEYVVFSIIPASPGGAEGGRT